MKKTLAKILILTVVLATGMFLLVACGGGNDSPYVGTWNAVKFEAYGVEMTPEDAGLTFSVEIKSNGEITATTNGESDGAAKWEATDDGIHITKSADSDDYVYNATLNDDGQMVLDMDGIKFYMEKQ